jgi:hypothetical protein
VDARELAVMNAASIVSAPGLVLSIAIPWILGTLLVRVILGKKRYPMALYLGHGYLLGFFVCTLLLRASNSLSLPFNFLGLSSIQIILAAAIAWFIISRRKITVSEASAEAKNSNALATWEKTVGVLLLSLICLRLASIAQEVWLRPIFGWDAWDAWVPKTLQFYDSQSLSFSVGTIKDSHGIFSNLVHLWTMLGGSTTKTTLTGLPWLVALIALVFAMYGHLRALKISPLISLLACYFIASLPFLNIHSMLVGFADLWLTLVFTLGILSLTLYSNTRQIRVLLLSVFYALLCGAIKQAGIVMGAILVACIIAQILIQLDKKWLSLTAFAIFAGAALVVIVVFTTEYQVNVDLPLVGEIVFRQDRFKVSGLTVILKEYVSIIPPLTESSFFFASWHLVVYLFLFVLGCSVIKRAWLLSTHPVVLATLSSFIFVWLYHSFVAPGAAYGHQGLSRALMYITPSMVYWIILVILAYSNQQKRSTAPGSPLALAQRKFE